MKKWIFIGIGVAIILVITVIVIGLKNLGLIIRTAVNKYGPDITKTAVRLGNVGVSLFSAKAELRDFYLGNPEGFKSSQAIKVESIQVDMDKNSLTKDTIIINRIEVVAPEITYEKIQGTDNFKTIIDNVKKSIGADKTSGKGSSEEKKVGKKIIIQDFIIKDGMVNLVMPFLGEKTLSAPLPEIHLKDLGKEKGGASPAEIFNEIFSALYEKITSFVVSDIFNKGLKFLGVSLETIGEGTKKGAQVITDKLKGLLGK